MSGVAPAVVAQGLTKKFGDFTAVDHLDLSIAKGEVVGFIGPNGAGKSTTIRLLCGLLTPTSGTASVAGYDVVLHPDSVRLHIGYMSQKFSLYGDLTVRENLRFFAGIYQVPRKEIPERIKFAVSMAGLEGREATLVGTLAGGWKQRLALGCAILHRPPVLFLDEPTSGVEPEAVSYTHLAAPDAVRDHVTRVLAGHIALAQMVFPEGVAGAHLDAFARAALWQAGLDYDHGTGHGVGAYLSVHEGPAGISRAAKPVALQPGMILSNEPGFYLPGAYGIRLENLVLVQPAEFAPQKRKFLRFETLTLAPFDRALIEAALLTAPALEWLNAYHARVFAELGPELEPGVRAWLAGATAKI